MKRKTNMKNLYSSLERIENKLNGLLQPQANGEDLTLNSRAIDIIEQSLVRIGQALITNMSETGQKFNTQPFLGMLSQLKTIAMMMLNPQYRNSQLNFEAIERDLKYCLIKGKSETISKSNPEWKDFFEWQHDNPDINKILPPLYDYSKLVQVGLPFLNEAAMLENIEKSMQKRLSKTTIGIKFRPSAIENKEGTIYYQIIHCRSARQWKTHYRIFPEEWNNKLKKINFPPPEHERYSLLMGIQSSINSDISKLKRTIAFLTQRMMPYTSENVITLFKTWMLHNSLYDFMYSVIEKQKLMGKIRTSEAYRASLLSFKKFRHGVDMGLDEMDSNVIMTYESYLKKQVSANTSSFYMRNLRAMYNRAVEKGLCGQKNPFKHVYTGVDKTVKRSVSLEVIRQIKEINLSGYAGLEFARDMFLFSFYTRGMSFVDMAFLRKKDLNGEILNYHRRKTGQQMLINWEKCMQDIVDKYNTGNSEYLLPIINSTKRNERQQYILASHRVNCHLKTIGKMLHISIPLTFYVARHSWANIMRSKNVPISIISEGMGHDSERTTRIYLNTFDAAVLDKLNKLILKSL